MDTIKALACQKELYMTNFIYEENPRGKPIKHWTKGVLFDENSREQVKQIASLPFIHKHIAVMPDVHLGKGATIGSVIATKGAIIPAAVGVDLSCGMMAVKTNLTANDMPDNLFQIRSDIEETVPHGVTSDRKQADKGSFREPQNNCINFWDKFSPRYKLLVEKHNKINAKNALTQLGTLGGGNHFIELCLDENDDVWIMLHTGSRGFGNKLASYFIELAKKDMEKYFINLPDKDMAYFPSKTNNYIDYMIGLKLASEYAFENRRVMMENVVNTLRLKHFPQIQTNETAINCHHNYVNTEHHFGENVLVTRKGAVRARTTDLGVIPGSMGAKSFIVRGKGNADSFCSCSHGAGRIMSRTKAKKTFTMEDHNQSTLNVECRKDIDVLDETPKAYKNIDDVMKAQEDLIEIVHTLKQIVCVKG